MTERATAPPDPSRAYLATTALVCGALVMVIEVLGSRVIGPFFGVSLFVWTSLITVTLVALAAGYAAGGVLADRSGSADRLYGIIVAAGVLVLLIPLAKGPVLRACVPLGLRTGALVSAAALFGPALFLLGCVSPYLVRIATREWARIGRTVGLLYALSTVGSFIGTVLAGFVLIARFGVTRIFAGTGCLLVALGLGYFLLRRRWSALAALLALPLVLLPAESETVTLVRPSGTRVTRRLSRDSFYGNVKVVDYEGAWQRTREMMIDGLVQGGVDPASGQSVYGYSYLMELLPWALDPGGRRCLVLGLGAGVVPMWYAARGVETDVVDIDPLVVRTARDWFGFTLGDRVVVGDARRFLATARGPYDYLVIDIFNGDTTPGHVLSLEALRLARGLLAPRGVLALNLVGSLRGETFMTASVARTLGEVFGTVEIHPSFAPEEGDGSGNLAVVAYDGPPRPFRPELVREFPVHPMARDEVAAALGRTFSFPAGTPAILLTDDYNPIDFFDLALRERVRRGILANTDWEVLI
jgi:spermidine synthase